MSYIWNEFNIKTFPAETIVYRDGVYCPELSTLPDGPIAKKYDLPIHIIYIGEIAGKCRLNIELGADNQNVIISASIKNKKPAFFDIFIKNAGENSEIKANIMMQNMGSELNYNCDARHMLKNTAIFVKNKLFAGKNSVSKLSGVSIIDKDCPKCKSDMSFVAMVESGAKTEFMPAQRISAEPICADHSAAIYCPTDMQITYLRGAGLSTLEIKDVMREAFLNDYE